MTYTIFLIALATIVSTFLGGLFAIRLKDQLHLILGFSAGAVIGVAFFDLIPESIELATKAYDITLVTLLMAVGFAFFMVLDRLFSIHIHEEKDCCKENHRGTLTACALSFHSFLDGLGVGLAFKISPTVGWIMAIAVLAHKFSDGINTVNVILKNHGTRKDAFKWLVIAAIAPAFGVVAAMFIVVAEPMLGLILSLFTGLFIYIGASDLIPESHHNHPTLWTTVSTILGIFLIYLIIQFAA
jgi:ZIP family zinc transporter